MCPVLQFRIRLSNAENAVLPPPGSKRRRELTIPNPLRVLTGVLIELRLKFREFGRTTPGTRIRPEEADEATGKPAQSRKKAKERSQIGHHTPPDISMLRRQAEKSSSRCANEYTASDSSPITRNNCATGTTAEAPL
jgi:hypothetical protein